MHLMCLLVTPSPPWLHLDQNMQHKDTHLMSVVVSSEHFLNPGCELLRIDLSEPRVKMICAMFAGGVESARPEERLVLTGPD